MPKLETKKIKNFIKNHVSLNGKIIQIHCKNKCFQGLAGCVREQKRYPKNTKNAIEIHPQIDINLMLEKMMRKAKKIIPKRAQKETKSHSKPINQNDVEV